MLESLPGGISEYAELFSCEVPFGAGALKRLELFELAVEVCKFKVDLTDGGVEDVESVLICQVSNDADALLVESADRGFEFPTLPGGGGAVITGRAFGDVIGGKFGEGVGVG